MKRRIFKLIICFTIICLSGAPASADLFHFDATYLEMTFDGTRLDASLYDPWGELTLIRDVAPVETVNLQVRQPGLGAGALSLWMDLDNITATTATAIGGFTITDVDGDTLTGGLTGNWALIGDYPYFSGSMSNIQWTSSDGFFNGNNGSDDSSVPLDFASGPPWDGTITELTTAHTAWFSDPWEAPYAVKRGGSIQGVVVPIPAAVFLGILGLGAVGIKLHKYT